MIITFKTFKMNAFNCIFELRLGNYPSRWFNYIQQILQSTFMQYSLMRCAAELRKSNAISDSQLYSSCQEEVSRTTSVSLQRKNCKVKIHDLLSWGSSLNSAKKKTKKCNFGKDKNQHFCREGFFQVVRGHYSRRDNFFKTYHFACDQYIFASALFLNFKTLSSARNAHTHTTRHPWFCFKKKVC